MDGKIKVILLTIILVTVCITILFSLLFIALWQYRVIVGVSLLVILLCGVFSVCVVVVRGNTFAQFPQSSYPPVLKQERISSSYDQLRY